MKKIIFGLIALMISVNTFAGYKLASVDKVKYSKRYKTFRITYTLPCKSVDFETFVVGSDDSGDLEMRVGVVYDADECRPGPMKKFVTVVTKNWPEYKILHAGLSQAEVYYVPMEVE